MQHTESLHILTLYYEVTVLSSLVHKYKSLYNADWKLTEAVFLHSVFISRSHKYHSEHTISHTSTLSYFLGQRLFLLGFPVDAFYLWELFGLYWIGLLSNSENVLLSKMNLSKGLLSNIYQILLLSLITEPLNYQKSWAHVRHEGDNLHRRMGNCMENQH